MARALFLFGLALVAAASVRAAEYLPPDAADLEGRHYSPAVLTKGGTTVYLAGVATATDGNGKDMTGDFEAQVREVFRRLEVQMKRSGGSLYDIVSMICFIKEPRYGDAFVKIRGEIWKDAKGKYPGSALLTIANFATPGIEVEVQAVAVIGDDCTDAEPCSLEAKKRLRGEL